MEMIRSSQLTDPEEQNGIDIHIQRSTTSEDKSWDDFLARTPGGSHIQTSKWSQVKAQLGWKAFRIIATKDDRTIGGAQVLIRPLTLGRTIGYVPRGPVLEEKQSTLVQQIINAIKRIAQNEKCLMMVIQPPRNDQNLAEALSNSDFRRTSFEVAPTATIIIDLEADHNEILARMKRGTRYNIRLSTRKPITISEGKQQDIEVFYDLLRSTGERENFRVFLKNYYHQMWRKFDPGGNIKLFLAKYNAQIVSAQLVIVFGDTVVNKFSVWSGEYGNCKPNERVYWSVMQWAKSHGYRYYDLEGIDRAAAEVLVEGGALPESMRSTDTHFKLGFGGEVVLFPRSHVYIPSAIASWGYQRLMHPDRIHPIILRVLSRVRTTANR